MDKGKPITKKIPFIEHKMVDIDDKNDILDQIDIEIQKYDIPVHESKSNSEPELNDDDLNLALGDNDEDA